MAQLQSRPLTSSEHEVYVRRRADDLVQAAIEAQENVLLGVPRGAGATSLLYRLEDEIEDAVYVNGEHASEAAEVLASVTARLDVPRSLLPDFRVLTSRIDPLAPPAVIQQLRAALVAAHRHPVILVDGPVDPTIAYQIFGRWRDEVFALPATWVVVAHHARLAEYLTPPADVFFDAVVPLEPLSQEEAFEILSRRGALEALTPAMRRAVIEAFDGTPRHLIRLARQQLALNDQDGSAHVQAHVLATAALSRGAHMLLAEMQGRGPVAATDPELRKRLGVTDRQMRRNLHELEEVGLVEVIPGARGTPGRPPATFQLTDIGQIRAGAA